VLLLLDLHSLWDGLLIAKAVRNVPRNYSHPLPFSAIEDSLRGAIYDPFIRRIMWEGPLDKWSHQVHDWLSCSKLVPESSTSPVVEAEGTWQKVLSGLRHLQSKKKGVEINPDGDVVCPYFWSQPLQALNCDIVWPKDDDVPQLDTPEYAGVIEERMILEKLLAQGGVRLAGVLNYLFAKDENVKGAFVMDLKA